jgi:OOP family OmpA-OmpF porin
MKLRYTAMALCISGLSPSLADATTEDGLYAGIGLGLSRVSPDTSGTIYSVDNDRSTGGRLFLGYDLTRRWALEGYYSDLGTADLLPDGSIGYKDIGLNAMYYFYLPEEGREGLSVFVRGGVGSMMNDAGVPYNRLNDTHVMVGAGAEYGLGSGWAVRADLDLYDRDAQLFTLGIMKRFGSEAEPAPAPAPVVVQRPAPVIVPVEVVNPDKDGDGILNAADACPATPAGVKVDETGCKLKAVIVLEGVIFAVNSDELIGDSTTILDAAARSLKPYPELRIEVGGHTDWQGSGGYNQVLSEHRANAVRSYLIGQGIAADHLSAKGYGEMQPVADNHTPEGRKQNRRVELRMLDNTLDAVQQSVPVVPVVIFDEPVSAIELCEQMTTGCELKKVISLEGVSFASKSEQMIGDSTAILDALVVALKAYPEHHIEVGAHTDWKGVGTSNQALSERRANVVRDYMIGQGMAANLLSARGYGEMQPVANNRTAEGRALNRRIELRMLDDAPVSESGTPRPAVGSTASGNMLEVCSGVTVNKCQLKEQVVLEGVGFAINSDELLAGSSAVLDMVAETLKRHPEQRVEVGSHTDWKGSGPSNQALSVIRAYAVRDYLIGQGVAAENITAKGYGEMQPVANNRTPEGREKNRRTELRVVK